MMYRLLRSPHATAYRRPSADPRAAVALQIVVIAATNRPDDVDPAVLRRLPLSFQVPLPNAEGRADVLRLLLRNEPLAANIDVLEVARATEGYSCSDLDQLCKTAAMRALEEALQLEKQQEPPLPDDVLPSASPVPSTAQGQSPPRPPSCQASTGGASSSAEPTPPQTTLRKLTLDDFLMARAVVRPTQGRFAGVHHDVHSVAPPPPADLDDELYN